MEFKLYISMSEHPVANYKSLARYETIKAMFFIVWVCCHVKLLLGECWPEFRRTVSTFLQEQSVLQFTD